jgi:hypothetical protein
MRNPLKTKKSMTPRSRDGVRASPEKDQMPEDDETGGETAEAV